MVFFDRFYREVFGVDGDHAHRRTSRRSAAKSRPEYGELFDGILHDCAETLRKDPSDLNALVRGITVYMVVIEGTLALTGARFIIRSLKQNDWLPGFRQGFTAVNRDESRHVGFGVKFLADAIKQDETLQADGRRHAQGDAADRDAGARPADGGRPVRLRDPVRVHLGGDLRVRDAVAVEEAGRDGHGAHWRRRPEAAPRPGPGRPSTGARERILAAGLEVLKSEGYAGLTMAKVAARSGQNKALIALPLRLQGRAPGGGRPRGRRLDHGRGGPGPGRPAEVEELVRGVARRALAGDGPRRAARAPLLRPGGGLRCRARGAGGDAGDQGRLSRGADRAAERNGGRPAQAACRGRGRLPDRGRSRDWRSRGSTAARRRRCGEATETVRELRARSDQPRGRLSLNEAVTACDSLPQSSVAVQASRRSGGAKGCRAGRRSCAARPQSSPGHVAQPRFGLPLRRHLEPTVARSDSSNPTLTVLLPDPRPGRVDDGRCGVRRRRADPDRPLIVVGWSLQK